MRINRRTVLYGVGTAGVSIPVAGCLGDADNSLVDTTVTDRDTFRFEASTDEEIVLDINNQNGSFTAVELAPVADRSEPLVSEPVEDEREITLTAPEDGRYELSIVPDGRAAVTVTVD